MRRLLVNDTLSVSGEVTFWNLLQDWLGAQFQGGDFATLSNLVGSLLHEPEPDYPEDTPPSVIVRNASYFPPILTQNPVPVISLLQDIFGAGNPLRKVQEDVIASSRAIVFNSVFTASHYSVPDGVKGRIIPLPVDFSLFEIGNPMGLQQALSLPDGCICWVGAWQEAAGQIKGWDIFQKIVRTNPDLHFVAVLKDGLPPEFPPNLRCYAHLKQEELVRVIGACRVGLCTSRIESQHLAGIEMGACGLPLVVPQTGIYFGRDETFPGILMPRDSGHETYSRFLRTALDSAVVPQDIRGYWQREFDRKVIREQWRALIEEVECSGVS